ALMFLDRSVPRISREYERFAFARETKRHIAQEIQRCIDANLLPAALKPAAAMRVLMVGMVGVAALSLSERLAPGGDAELVASDVLDATIAGLRAGVPLKSEGSAVECPTGESIDAARAS